MRILEKNWKVVTSFFPTGWRQMARPSGAVERWRGFPSPDVLLRMLLLHVAKGYSLRETVVRAMLANWTDISDVALLKRLRNWRGVAMLVVHRIASGKRCMPTRRSYQLHDPDCGSDTDSSAASSLG